jgi:hypothetical protein
MLFTAANRQVLESSEGTAKSHDVGNDPLLL